MPTIGAFSLFAARRACRSEAESRDGAVEAGIAEGEDPAVGGHEPVAAVIGRRRDPDHRTLEGQRPRRPVELRRTEGEDPAVGADQPVTVLARRSSGAGLVLYAVTTKVVVPLEAVKLENPNSLP